MAPRGLWRTFRRYRRIGVGVGSRAGTGICWDDLVRDRTRTKHDDDAAASNHHRNSQRNQRATDGRCEVAISLENGCEMGKSQVVLDFFDGIYVE